MFLSVPGPPWVLRAHQQQGLLGAFRFAISVSHFGVPCALRRLHPEFPSSGAPFGPCWAHPGRPLGLQLLGCRFSPSLSRSAALSLPLASLLLLLKITRGGQAPCEHSLGAPCNGLFCGGTGKGMHLSSWCPPAWHKAKPDSHLNEG